MYIVFQIIFLIFLCFSFFFLKGITFACIMSEDLSFVSILYLQPKHNCDPRLNLCQQKNEKKNKTIF